MPLLRAVLHYVSAVAVDTTRQCFYLDVFLQLFFPTACHQQNAGLLKGKGVSQGLASAVGISWPGDSLKLQLNIMHRM